MSDKILVATEENGALALRRKEPLEIESLNDAIQIAAKTVVTDSSAELLAKTGETEQVPYNFRTSGGAADIGDRETDMVVGGTVAWNQIVAQGDMTDATKWSKTNCTLSCADNVGTFVRTDLTQTGRILANQGGGAYNNQPYKADHKVLICADLKADALTSGSIALRYKAEDVASITPNGYTAGTWKHTATIKTWNTDSNTTYVQVFDYRTADEGEGLNNVYVKNVMIFDLTQMFGVTIADYIYSLEQSSAGSGVEWFRKLFPNDYYAYDAGTLRSVNVSSHNMVGFNAIPEQMVTSKYWHDGVLSNANANYAAAPAIMRVVPGATYCLATPNKTGTALTVYISDFDANQNFIRMYYLNTTISDIKYVTFAVSEDAAYIAVHLYRSGGIASSEIVNANLNLSWDGEKDGTYEPYVKYSYPLDDSLTLRGIPKLDANNKLYYDGDTYASDGTVTRRYGIVDMGTLTWTASSSYGFYANITDAKKNTNDSRPGNLICSKLPTVSYNNALSIYASDPKAPFVAWKRQNIETRGVVAYDNASTTAGEFTTAMSGVMLVYELDTPTTETADPYTNPQIVSDWGTEEYVDAGVEAGARDVAIPVGHETFYHEPLRKKIENLPKDFSTLIADTEKAMTATRNYTAGEFLIIRNQLYKVTANIANGGTITPGVNVTETTVAEQITALWAAVNS